MNQSIIKEIYDIAEVLNSKATLFFFDIEETILAPNVYYELLSHEEYIDLFMKICSNLSIRDVIYVGKHFYRELMQPVVVEVIQKLKNRGSMVFALTSGFPSQQKRNRITERGIFLNGFLFSRGQAKGQYLSNFLTAKNLLGNCCFIDNDLHKIKNVQEVFAKNFPDRFIDLYHYRLIENISQDLCRVNKEAFQDYWRRVVVAVKNGALQIIRNNLKYYQFKRFRSTKRHKQQQQNIMDTNINIPND